MAPLKKWDEESESSEEETSSDEESVEVKTQTLPVRKKFDDEEDSDDAVDDWEAAEDSEEERKKEKAKAEAKAKADAEAAKNKKSKAQRVEEHREANRKKKVADMDDEESDEEEDEATKREKFRQQEKDGDLLHAEDLLSTGMGPKSRGAKAIVVENKDKPGEAIDLSSISLFKPATKTQFEQLSEVLVPLLRASTNKPHYSIWMQNFAKQICQDMPSTEIKKVASALTALSNERLKAEKDADKTGKKTKAQKTKTVLAGAGRDMGRGNADTTAYEEGGLEEDDFM